VVVVVVVMGGKDEFQPDTHYVAPGVGWVGWPHIFEGPRP